MQFAVRAKWFGPDGRQMGVADDTAEGDCACDVIDAATPGEWYKGEFTSAQITITPIAETEEAE